jgi:anti-anti-sigma factor
MVRYYKESNITEEETLVCAFKEKLDTAHCADIEKELFDKVREEKIPVVFDLQEIDYIASSFLGMCIRIAKEVGPGNFSIINVKPNVKKVFKISGLDRQMTIY